MIIVSVIGKSVAVVLSSSPDGYSHIAACLLPFIYLLSLYEPVIFRLVEKQSIVFVCVCSCMHVCLKCLCENNFNTTLLPVKLSCKYLTHIAAFPLNL